MKAIALTMVAFSLPLVCTVFAGLLALQGKNGWGWFLLVALLIGGSIKIKTR